MWRIARQLAAVHLILLGVGSARAQDPQAAPEAAAPPLREPLFEGLGSLERRVTTDSAEAQQYFNQGLCFLYAFNHDEAIRSFRQAARLDANCAMAWWGIAVANGPHINNPIVPPERSQAAWEALQRASAAAAAAASPSEQALIQALAARYANPPPEERTALDAAYATAMGEVWKQFPEDGDIGALYAEALMDLRPWDLWTEDKQPQPGTERVVATLEQVLEKHPRHPLALHLYIHAVEASAHPERAADAADRLRDLQPGLAHLVHMPSHIDVLLGQWEKACETNRRAIEADRVYRAQRPEQGFYRLYMLHNHHMLAFAAMMRGQQQQAMSAIEEMVAGIPAEWVRENALFADGYVAQPLKVMMRFGLWEEILAVPEPPDYCPLSRTLRHYARSVAYAAQGHTAEAREEQQLFARQREQIHADATFGNNPAADVVAVAERLMEGEILFREGNVEPALEALREAVSREDALRYDEPPDWIQPVRHALGAALMQSGRYAEAEQVYRADLQRHPHNGWSLFGLSRALELQGKSEEAATTQQAFRKAWKDADIELSSSCFCLPGV